MDTAHLFLRGRTQGHKGLPTPGSWSAEVHTTLQCTLKRHKGLMGLSKQITLDHRVPARSPQFQQNSTK